MISGQQEFFSEQPGGQDIFFPSRCSAGYFFPLLISLQEFFPRKRVMCLHIQNVFTFTLWSLQ